MQSSLFNFTKNEFYHRYFAKSCSYFKTYIFEKKLWMATFTLRGRVSCSPMGCSKSKIGTMLTEFPVAPSLLTLLRYFPTKAKINFNRERYAQSDDVWMWITTNTNSKLTIKDLITATVKIYLVSLILFLIKLITFLYSMFCLS